MNKFVSYNLVWLWEASDLIEGSQTAQPILETLLETVTSKAQQELATFYNMCNGKVVYSSRVWYTLCALWRY